MTPDEQAAIGNDIYAQATALLAEYDERITAGEDANELAVEFERRMPKLPETIILNPLSR